MILESNAACQVVDSSKMYLSMRCDNMVVPCLGFDSAKRREVRSPFIDRPSPSKSPTKEELLQDAISNYSEIIVRRNIYKNKKCAAYLECCSGKGRITPVFLFFLQASSWGQYHSP